MSSTIKVLRSSSTALTPGVSTLAFGELAYTNISSVSRYYIGNASNLAVEIAGDAYAKLASPAFSGTPTAPTASAGTNTTQVATTAFVTTAVQASAAGLVNKGIVVAATTAALPANTYDNGTSGVGATITADANGALPAQDGITLIANDLFLVKDESGADAPNNGIYVVTAVGDGSNPFVLTRATNFNSATTIIPNSIVTISKGTTQEDEMWWIELDGAVTVGTTDIVFSQFGVTPSITAGDGLTKTGDTLDVNVDASTTEINGSNQVAVKAGGITGTQLATSVAGAGLAGGGGSALSVNVDNSSIEISTDTLQVKALGITNAMLAGSIADSKLSTITTANKVSGSAVQLASGSAIENNTGLDVNIDGTSIVNTAGELSVALVDGGTF